ncbi:unnamed protein product, partial [marine sediment metagenome]
MIFTGSGVESIYDIRYTIYEKEEVPYVQNREDA